MNVNRCKDFIKFIVDVMIEVVVDDLKGVNFVFVFFDGSIDCSNFE